MLAYAHTPSSICKAEAGGLPRVGPQAGILSETTSQKILITETFITEHIYIHIYPEYEAVYKLNVPCTV